MINMSYCQYENTYYALKEIVERGDIEDMSEQEKRFKVRLQNLCRDIAEEAEDE